MSDGEPFDIIAEAKAALERCKTMRVPSFEHRPLELIPNDPLWQDPVFCEVVKMFEEKR